MTEPIDEQPIQSLEPKEQPDGQEIRPEVSEPIQSADYFEKGADQPDEERR